MGFTLAACAMPSRLALRPRGLRYALAACATPSRLALRPRGSGFALAARAMPLRLALRPRGLAFPLRVTLRARGLGCGGGSGGGGGSGSNGSKCLPSRLALRTCRLGLRPRGSALPASPLQLALCACGSASPKHNNQIAKQRQQKLLWQRCRLSAKAVAAGGISAGYCGGIGYGSIGGSVSVSSNGGGGGGGSSGGRWQRRWKWRRQ